MKNCIWCDESIKEAAKICNHCERDQSAVWGTLQRYAPMMLIIGGLGLIFALISVYQASEERKKAEEAVSRAEAAISDSAYSLEVAINAQNEAQQIADDLTQLIADANSQKRDVGDLIDQARIFDSHLQSLVDQLNGLNEHTDKSLQEAQVVINQIDERISNIDNSSMNLADIVYAGRFINELEEHYYEVRVSALCKISYALESTLRDQATPSANCLGAILSLRNSFAEMLAYAESIRTQMSNEAWKNNILPIVCNAYSFLSNGPLKVSISDYLNSREWREWAGYAQLIISSTSPFLEENTDLRESCNDTDGFDPRFVNVRFSDNTLFSNSPIYLQEIFSYESIERQDLRKIEFDSGSETIKILLEYENEIREIYEWPLEEGPKVRIIN